MPPQFRWKQRFSYTETTKNLENYIEPTFLGQVQNASKFLLRNWYTRTAILTVSAVALSLPVPELGPIIATGAFGVNALRTIEDNEGKYKRLLSQTLVAGALMGSGIGIGEVAGFLIAGGNAVQFIGATMTESEET
jgi:hypothetical protein